MSVKPLVDPKCYDLAEYFLPADAGEPRTWDLAAVVQRAVEDWLINEDNAPREEYPDNGPTYPWETSGPGWKVVP